MFLNSHVGCELLGRHLLKFALATTGTEGHLCTLRLGRRFVQRSTLQRDIKAHILSPAFVRTIYCGKLLNALMYGTEPYLGTTFCLWKFFSGCGRVVTFLFGGCEWVSHLC